MTDLVGENKVGLNPSLLVVVCLVAEEDPANVPGTFAELIDIGYSDGVRSTLEGVRDEVVNQTGARITVFVFLLHGIQEVLALLVQPVTLLLAGGRFRIPLAPGFVPILDLVQLEEQTSLLDRHIVLLVDKVEASDVMLDLKLYQRLVALELVHGEVIHHDPHVADVPHRLHIGCIHGRRGKEEEEEEPWKEVEDGEGEEDSWDDDGREESYACGPHVSLLALGLGHDKPVSSGREETKHF